MFRKVLLTLTFCLFAIPYSFAQIGAVSGEITDARTGETLAGVNIYVSDLQRGAVTDLDGQYRIENIPVGEYRLRITYIGYATLEENVMVNAGENVRDFTMNRDLIGLDEMVVIGYGERQRRDITGSVASVSARQIENATVTTPEQLMQGRTAGVQVSAASGVPGGSVNVRVRGASSITAGNQPLYVVDGIPIIYGETGGAVGQRTNALADLNPSDIESIEVLKDASATAIYGSRGANGVVLITTKRGTSQGFTDFNATYFRGVTDATFKWDVLSGPEWAEVYREAFDNYSTTQFGQLIPNLETLFGYPAVPAVDDAPNYDYIDEAFRSGVIQEASISARGGDMSTRYFLSGTYHETEGYIIENQYRRLSGRLNLEHDATERIRVGANIGITRTLNTRPPSDNLVAGTLTSGALIPPIVPIYNDDGTYNFSNPWNIADNPIGVGKVNTYSTNHWRAMGNLYGEVRPTQHLALRVTGGLDLLHADDYRRYSELSGDGAPDGLASQAIRETQNWTLTATANYARTFQDVHRLTGVVGTEFQRNQRLNVIAAGTGFVSDLFPNVSSAAEVLTYTSLVDFNFGMESYFARAAYTYDNRYTFEGSARVDGSSRFGEDNKYGFFPAGAFAWRVSEESFFNVDLFTDLRFRVSYGITGNNQIGDFQSRGLYAGADYANIPGLYPAQLGNPDLSWESTKQLDIGLDAVLLNDRISLTADYYQKNTDDMLLPVVTPFSSGFASVVQNVGSMKNQGVEVSLETHNVTGTFQWSTRFNVSYNENEVTKLVDGEDIPAGLFRVREGEPLAAYYLIRWHGVDPETGRPQWLDADGEITHTPGDADRVFAGQADPPWFGGIENSLSYKGVSLDFFFQFAYGHEIYNDTYRFMMLPVTFNLHTNYLDRWQEEGDITDIPRNIFADTDNATRRSTRFLEDASYVRLRHINLSYSLPPSVTESLRVKNARLFVQANNLWTWHQLSVGDPEGTYDGLTGNLNRGELFFTPPQQRTITGGINLMF